MRTVKEVSKLTGVSVRTLHHYDSIGLLKPAKVTEAGYRLYDDAALERLQQILLFRELEFPLREIREILDSPQFDRSKALKQQVALLTLRKKRLEELIALACETEKNGVTTLNFEAFDKSRIDRYAAEAKAAYGKTAEYREFEEKSQNRTEEETKRVNVQMMELFTEFGAMRALPPDSEQVQAQVKKLQDFITEHFYTCSEEVLRGLGAMYAAGGEFTANIDGAGGKGTAELVGKAIEIFCCRSERKE